MIRDNARRHMRFGSSDGENTEGWPPQPYSVGQSVLVVETTEEVEDRGELPVVVLQKHLRRCVVVDDGFFCSANGELYRPAQYHGYAGLWEVASIHPELAGEPR